MGKALEVITGFVTAPSTTFTAVTMGSGNSLTVRNAPLDSKILLLQAWALNQTAGALRIRSPKLHDNVSGLRFRSAANTPVPKMPWGVAQKLYSQDVLTVEMTGSGTAGDVEQFGGLIYYDSLPGADARLITFDELMKRAGNVVVHENNITNGTAGGWSAEEAVNSEIDLWKANTDYALIGYTVDADCSCVRWRGADSANLGVGGPGDVDGAEYTQDWFARLAKYYSLPLIPVFNSANKAAILVDLADDENATAHCITETFIEIGPAGVVK